MSKLYNPFTDETVEIGKADDDEPRTNSAGRKAWASAYPGYHAAIAGKPGKKGRAFGNEYGGALLGAAPGMAAMTRARSTGGLAASVGAGAAGSAIGAIRGNNRNARKGYLKPVQKRLVPADPASGTNVRAVTPLLPRGPHVSHENDLWEHGRRRTTPHGDTQVRRYRGKGSKPAEGGQPIRKDDHAADGASRRGSRGTPAPSPFADVGRSGRVGHRLTLA